MQEVTSVRVLRAVITMTAEHTMATPRRTCRIRLTTTTPTVDHLTGELQSMRSTLDNH